MLVVNLFSGPNGGKSVMAANLFSRLKMQGINAELVTEFAKDLTWEKRYDTLKNQVYLIGEQYQRMLRLKDQVDVLITDSPILLGSIYCPDNYPQSWYDFNLWLHNQFNNLNFFIQRDFNQYQKVGRKESKDDAFRIDSEIVGLLYDEKILFKTIKWDGIDIMIADILNNIRHISKTN